MIEEADRVPARRRLWHWAVAAALALTPGAISAVLISGGQAATGTGPGPLAGPRFVVSGAVVIADTSGKSFSRDGRGGCAGGGDYANIRDGAPVVIYVDDRDSAVGQLTAGRFLTDGTCRFWFAVREVPAGHDRYRLQVSEQDGGEYSEADLKGGLVTMRLGG